MPEATPPEPPELKLAVEADEGSNGASPLPPGTRVAEFEIRRVLGSGGFGIVYLAWDHALEREVALKEYMPGTLAGRGAGLSVSVRSASGAETFALGLRSFVNEARLLARFDHPSLVKVYRFWEDNGTAYMVMPYYLGRTLRQMRAGMVVPPGEAACRRVLDALLSALEVLHKEGVFHRDIAPDNILIGDDGLPVLLDFGAARRVIGDGQKALTSIMKPHYAPLEQYADQSAMRQGPWTDLYALGGTIYFLLTGREPVPAASRALHDDQPRLAEMPPADCTPGFLAALDWMMAIKPPERPQSVPMLRDVIEGRMTLPGRKERTVPGVAARDGGVDIPTGPGDLMSSGFGATAMPAPWAPTPADSRTQVMPRATLPPSPTLPPSAPPAFVPEPTAAAPAKPSAAVMVLGLLVVLNILAWWWFATRSGPPGFAAPPAATVAGTPTAPAPAPAASAPNAATVSGGTVATPAKPSDEGGTETILSVLPARLPSRAASAAATASSAPGLGKPLPAANDPALAALPRALPDAAAAAAAAASQAARLRPAAAGATPATADAQNPRARCGDRSFIALAVCMKRECENPALRSHPECVKMRDQEESQQNHAR
jgi:serine/threonine protein kinase